MSSPLAIKMTFYLDALSRQPEASTAWRDDFAAPRRFVGIAALLTAALGVGLGVYLGLSTIALSSIGASMFFGLLAGVFSILGGRTTVGVMRPFVSLDESEITIRTRWLDRRAIPWDRVEAIEVLSRHVVVRVRDGQPIEVPLNGIPLTQANDMKTIFRQVARSRNLRVSNRRDQPELTSA
jgi:hypothetical protein